MGRISTFLFVVICILPVAIGVFIYAHLDGYSRDVGGLSGILKTPQTPFSLPDGKQVDLPILYRGDNSVWGMFFPVELEKASDLLAEHKVGTVLSPYQIFPGSAVALLVAFDYRNTSVGKYQEVGLAILTYKHREGVPSLKDSLWDVRSDPRLGFYVVTLPVTSEEALDAGVGVWGYPKYIRDISFGRGAGHGGSPLLVKLADEIEIHGSVPMGPELAGIPFVTFSQKGDQLIRTVIDVGYTARYGFGQDVSLYESYREFMLPDQNGRDPRGLDTLMSLKKLELLGPGELRRPFLAFYSDNFASILPEGEDAGFSRLFKKGSNKRAKQDKK